MNANVTQCVADSGVTFNDFENGFQDLDNGFKNKSIELIEKGLQGTPSSLFFLPFLPHLD